MRSTVQVFGISVAFLALALMGDVRSSNAQSGGDFRGAFSNFLANPPSGASCVTVGVVSGINGKLASDGVPMSKEHYIIATKSIANGDSVFEFARKENAEVMKSSGQGWFYGLARFFHSTFLGGGGEGDSEGLDLSYERDRSFPWDNDFFRPRGMPWMDLGRW